MVYWHGHGKATKVVCRGVNLLAGVPFVCFEFAAPLFFSSLSVSKIARSWPDLRHLRCRARTTG
jgi:hypothetical protein